MSECFSELAIAFGPYTCQAYRAVTNEPPNTEDDELAKVRRKSATSQDPGFVGQPASKSIGRTVAIANEGDAILDVSKMAFPATLGRGIALARTNTIAELSTIRKNTTLPIAFANSVENRLSNAVIAFGEPLRKLTEELNVITTSIETYPARMKDGLLSMNQFGWYLDMNMGASKPIKFKQAVDAGREAEAEQIIVTHFESRFAAILNELSQALPTRAEILRAAFEAHKDQKYVLSIPVLLAQVDGICFDVADAHLFMGKERSKVRTYLSERAGSEITRAILAPLEAGMPVALSSSRRPTDFSGLNRHQVIHGESVDYGTKENSLRAISLLNNISQSLRRQLSESTDPPPEDE
jgi:hypothetical protein